MTLLEIVEHEASAIGLGEHQKATSSPARWTDWPNSSDGPGRARPKTMRTAWRSGTPRSGTAIGTWATMRVLRLVVGNAVAEPASWTETDRSSPAGFEGPIPPANTDEPSGTPDAESLFCLSHAANRSIPQPTLIFIIRVIGREKLDLESMDARSYTC